MQTKNSLCQLKLKQIEKSISGNYSQNEDNKHISELINDYLIFIQNNFNNLQCFEKSDQLIEFLLFQYYKNKDLNINPLFIPFLNQYMKKLCIDNYTAWGLIIYKILKSEMDLFYPTVFACYLQYYYPLNDRTKPDLNFPLDLRFSLHSVLQDLITTIMPSLQVSYSYHIVFHNPARSKIIQYFYDYYLKTRHLYLWFPFPGLGLEALMISYSFHLYNEIFQREKPSAFSVYLSENEQNLAEDASNNSANLNIYKQLKSAVCRQNNFAEKKIKTTIKTAKHKIHKLNDDNQHKKKLDFIFIGYRLSYKKLEYPEYLTKIVNDLKKINQNPVRIIIEYQTKFKQDWQNYVFNNFTIKKVIFDGFLSKQNDIHLVYLEINLKSQSQNVSEQSESIDEIYLKKDSFNIKYLKNIIKNINEKEIKNTNQLFKLCSLYLHCTLYKKCWNILKNIYQKDYKKTYDLLKHFLDNCKNEKLNKKILSFIKNTELKETAFNAELLDVIKDEIDNYFAENPDSLLKSEKWT